MPMHHGTSVHAAVVVCIGPMAVLTHLANGTESAFLQLDPALRFTQTPVSSASSQTTTSGGPTSPEELAKKLSNPVSSLISVPFQSNFDFNTGLDNDKLKYTLNIRPVIPLSISTDWNLIARIIQPVMYQDELFPGLGSKFGLGT